MPGPTTESGGQLQICGLAAVGRARCISPLFPTTRRFAHSPVTGK